MRTATYPGTPVQPFPHVLRGTWHWLTRGISERTTRTVRGGGAPERSEAKPAPHDGVPGIDEFYHHRRLDLVRLALLLVDDLPTAEDVVQDAFTSLYRRYGDRLAGLDSPEAYVRTSVVNGARSVLRRRRTVRAHIPEREGHAPPAEEYVLLQEEHRDVLKALRRLTRRQREVLVLRYWSNLTEAQIAQTLGLAQGTVKSTALSHIRW